MLLCFRTFRVKWPAFQAEEEGSSPFGSTKQYASSSEGEQGQIALGRKFESSLVCQLDDFLTVSKQGVGVPLLTEIEPGSIPGRSAKKKEVWQSGDCSGLLNRRLL